MEVCWCGCGAEWPATDTSYDWAASGEAWVEYTEPVYAEPVYAEPVYAEPVYTEPVYTEPVFEETVPVEPTYAEPVLTDPVQAEPLYVEPAYTAPVYEEPVIDAPVADPNIAIVGGPTAGFEPAVFDQPVVADAGIALVGGPSAGITTDVFVSEPASVSVPDGNGFSIGGEPLPEYDLSATAWDRSWDIFMNNNAVTSGDPIADQIILDNIATNAMNASEISMSNAMTSLTTWGTPSSDFSYNSSGRLVNNPYYNEYKP